MAEKKAIFNVLHTFVVALLLGLISQVGAS